jgi:hypothetical protein
LGAESWTGSWSGYGAGMGAGSWSGSGADLGADLGVDLGADSTADSGADSIADLGVDSGAGSWAGAEVDSGMFCEACWAFFPLAVIFLAAFFWACVYFFVTINLAASLSISSILDCFIFSYR